MNKKIPVIIDCDPGIDDALALVVAFSLPELEIKAVTCVAGNVSIDNVTQSARVILGCMGVKSKIYRGADGPLASAAVIDASDIHGESGLGYYQSDGKNLHPLEKESALEGFREVLTKSEEQVTIIAVGPLTNIAILLKAYPELKSKIKQFSIMGGGLYTGNHTPAAEFNILADPEAAHVVFSSGIPIIMAGLDVTHQARIYRKDMPEISAVGNQVSDMICKAVNFNFDVSYKETERDDDFVCMHDVCSVLVLLYPDMFKGENLRVMVETAGVYSRGLTLADMRMRHRGKNANCHVLLEIDREKFYAKVIQSLRSYSKA